MTEDCKIIWRNDLVAVVDFKGTHVQIPAPQKDAEFVTLKKVKDGYLVVDANKNTASDEETNNENA